MSTPSTARNIMLAAAKWANRVAQATPATNDDQEVLTVESFLLWAEDAKYNSMTAWQRAVWAYLAGHGLA